MRILITGGTGSLGHALAAYYLKETDHRLVIFSRDEYKQAMMGQQFSYHRRLDFFLGDVRDRARLDTAMDAHFDVIIHTAALKRVDAVARDPDEIFKTNVEGTRNVLHAAKGKVNKFLLISSDKACYPTNAYGVTKAMAEHLTLGFNIYSIGKPMCSVVRYGNVLSSRGSVLEVWKHCIEKNQPIPITDEQMTRFFLTLPRAVEYIQRSLEMMKGNEVFVPYLPTAKIIDLKQAYAKDYPYEVIGLRCNGEKLHETLATEEEQVTQLDHDLNVNSMTGQPRLTIPELQTLLQSIRSL